MNYALQRYLGTLPVPLNDMLALGRVNPQNADEPFCMTVLALKLSRAANAVSELHGDVSRHMWQALYPGVPVRSEGSHRPHHQRHSPAGLDERSGPPVLARKLPTAALATPTCSGSSQKTGRTRQQRRVLAEDDRPGICFRRGTLGVALPAAPRAD
jgi:hypothetical protein